MQSSPWLHATTSPAICPKCKAPALHRSHTQSRMEERRKHATGKRPYRCHVCGHRGWFDETALLFPASAQKPLSPGVAGKDVPVPDLQLDDVEPLSVETKNTGSSSDSAGSPSDSAGSPSDSAGSSSDSDRSPSDSAGSSSDSAGSPSDSDGDMSRAPVNGEEAFSVPEFGKDVGSPVSVKVSPAFHHHARNKSHACPACGEFALYRSRARHLGERLRKRLSRSRPFRCHRCGWRGWMQRK